jgi:hypothetical protein
MAYYITAASGLTILNVVWFSVLPPDADYTDCALEASFLNSVLGSSLMIIHT